MKELKGTLLDHILQKYFKKELTEKEAIQEIVKSYKLKKAPNKGANEKY